LLLVVMVGVVVGAWIVVALVEGSVMVGVHVSLFENEAMAIFGWRMRITVVILEGC
jgi:hypothetical protein